MNQKQLDELLRIQRLHRGLLMPKEVVSEAREENNPLHGYFDWDDSVAAEKWRIEQARGLIQVAVEYVNDNKEPVRVFVSLQRDRMKGGYRRLETVMSDDVLKAELLRESLVELNTLRNRYRQLVELSKVFREINKVSIRYKNKITIPMEA